MIALGLVILLWSHFERHVTLGDTAAAAGALVFIFPRLNEFVAALGLFHENALFVEDFSSFLSAQQDKERGSSKHPLPELLSGVVLDRVTFTYPEQSVPSLTDVSLEVRVGETVALVGENGAGKTTLAKLLCRLYQPDAGTIKWDNRDLSAFAQEDVSARIAVIFQDFIRYPLSVRENIGFGDVSAMEDLALIERAAARAGADEFLRSLPHGYETKLGKLFDEGHDLSLGQWQRVALARAFLRDAPLVILDEPTASLDARAEYELFQVMHELFRDRAVLLISHRFSSVRMADRIYVLKKGRVVEQGRHKELLASGGLYAELFELQASSYLRPHANGATGHADATEDVESGERLVE